MKDKNDMNDSEVFEEFERISKNNTESERQWFQSWGYVGAPVMAAGLAYQEFIQKETKYNPHNFYKVPLARKAFMIGWLRNFK